MYLKEHLFPAVLKSEDDRVLAEGLANISLENKSVEFHNQFVPLLPFDSLAKICRIKEELETHCFVGKVYLSSPTLLRIVNVNEKLLAEAALEVLQSISVKAFVSPITEQRKFLNYANQRSLKFEVNIFSISLHEIRFVSKSDFQEGEHLLVHFIPPPLTLKKVLVEVIQLLLFGEKTVYRCNILHLPHTAREELSEYLLRQSYTSQEKTTSLPPEVFL